MHNLKELKPLLTLLNNQINQPFGVRFSDTSITPQSAPFGTGQ